jgi:hypothetical protein
MTKKQALPVITEIPDDEKGDVGQGFKFKKRGDLKKGSVPFCLKSAHSITSALKMSDYVIVPIYNEFKCLVAGLNTISQILEYNNNIIVVATKYELNKLNKLNKYNYFNIFNQ